MKTQNITRMAEIERLFAKPANYEDIKADIIERGIKDPLVVNPGGNLICGYTRLNIAEELQMEDIPVREEDLTDILDMKEYAIKDNLNRRQLSKLEMVELYGRELESIESEKAKQRMKRGKADPMDIVSGGLTVDKVGEALGMSGKTYQRWKIISECGSTNTRVLLNKGIINMAAALELCKLPQVQQDKLIDRIKSVDNPRTINWLTIKDKVLKYGKKDIELYRKREAEIKRETIPANVDPFEMLVTDILNRKPLPELEILEKEAQDGTLWQNSQFVSEVGEGIINDEVLRAEFLKRYEEQTIDERERKVIDASLQDRAVCCSCMYVEVYEVMEGGFANRRDFRKLMYPLAAQMVAYFRPDLFIDGTLNAEAAGRVTGFQATDWAELKYLTCKKFKEENGHDCFEQRNMSVIHDPSPNSIQPPGIEGAEKLLEDYEAGREIKSLDYYSGTGCRQSK